MGHSPTTPWESIKADYFAQNLRRDKTRELTLQELSVKWCVPYGTLRNKASKENWGQRLHEKIKEQNARAIAEVQAEEVFTEAETRRRQAKVARLMRDLGLRRLRSVDPDDLSIKDAIELVKLGLVGERQALGFARASTFPSPLLDDSKWEPVEVKIREHRKVEGLAAELMEYLEEKRRQREKQSDFS